MYINFPEDPDFGDSYVFSGIRFIFDSDGGWVTTPGVVQDRNTFVLFGQTVTADYTVDSATNALTAGPITIADGVSVTIPTGSYWTIV